MTQRELFALLQGAQSLIGQAMDAIDVYSSLETECEHPKEMLEPLPATMGQSMQLVRCGECGKTLEIPWEETTDGET